MKDDVYCSAVAVYFRVRAMCLKLSSFVNLKLKIFKV